MKKPLTVEIFIEAFRLDTSWKCEPNTRITNLLTEFAKEREGSKRNIFELLTIFKIAYGINPGEIHNSKKIEELVAIKPKVKRK